LHDIFQEHSLGMRPACILTWLHMLYLMVYTALFWNLSCSLLKPVSYGPVNLGRKPNRIMVQNGAVHDMGELYSCLLFS